MARALKNLLGVAVGFTPMLARDVLGTAGLSGITYGAWLIYRPAGFIIGGIFAVIVAVLLSAIDQKADG